MFAANPQMKTITHLISAMYIANPQMKTIGAFAADIMAVQASHENQNRCDRHIKFLLPNERWKTISGVQQMGRSMH